MKKVLLFSVIILGLHVLFSYKQENRNERNAATLHFTDIHIHAEEIIDFKKFCYANFYHLRTHVIVERGGDNHVRH